jgi:hypothetical protein
MQRKVTKHQGCFHETSKIRSEWWKKEKPVLFNDMMQFVIPILRPATSDVSGSVLSPASIQKQNTEIEDF